VANPVLARAFDTRQQQAPIGPITATDDVMTGNGVIRSFAVLSALFVPAAIFGWTRFDGESFPSWVLGAFVVAIVAVIAGSFKPTWAPFIGPVYALVEGAIVGVVSRLYETAYDGLIVQAVLATTVTVFVMAVLYVTRTIEVTERLRSVVTGATLAIFAFYLISFGLSFFDIGVPLIWDTGLLGIGFSLLVIGIAAFNLLLDFDLIERGVKGRAPGYMNWYAAFGLMVTIVWLYLEFLRLLSKLQRR
jgi:uncharacterized YccA/Bax inhibitor family protein